MPNHVLTNLSTPFHLPLFPLTSTIVLIRTQIYFFLYLSIGNTAVVHFLAGQGVSVNVPSADGWLPIHRAVTEVIPFLYVETLPSIYRSPFLINGYTVAYIPDHNLDVTFHCFRAKKKRYIFCYIMVLSWMYEHPRHIDCQSIWRLPKVCNI